MEKNAANGCSLDRDTPATDSKPPAEVMTLILIIDNRSSFIKRFRKELLIPSGIPFRMVPHDKPLPDTAYSEARGLILSGGKGTPWAPLVLTADFQALMNLDVPTMGFCLGHEILAVAYGGGIGPMPSRRRKWDWVDIQDLADPVFSGLPEPRVRLRMQHHHHVTQLPRAFKRIGSSSQCPVEIIRHEEKPLYGFQGHPEVSGPEGWLIMRNWFALCGYGTGA